MLEESQREAKPLNVLTGSFRGTKSLLWSNNQGRLRGAKPLFYTYSPFPLLRGRGIKGDGVTE